MNQPKVLVIIGDAAETVDTHHSYYRIIEAGFQPVVAAPEVRRHQMVMHEEKPDWAITKEWEGCTLQAHIAFKDIKPEEYLGIFFSGGRAPEYIRKDEDLLRITRWFWENGNQQVARALGKAHQGGERVKRQLEFTSSPVAAPKRYFAARKLSCILVC